MTGVQRAKEKPQTRHPSMLFVEGATEPKDTTIRLQVWQPTDKPTQTFQGRLREAGNQSSSECGFVDRIPGFKS